MTTFWATIRARTLRRNATEAEAVLWRQLRNRQLDGWKFRRQQRIGPYIVDFLCPETRLIVEVDGGQHSPERDASRTSFLEGEGYRVLRFWNNDVLGNLAGVLEVIRTACAEESGDDPSQDVLGDPSQDVYDDPSP